MKFEVLGAAFRAVFFSPYRGSILVNELAAIGLALMLIPASVAIWDRRRTNECAREYNLVRAVWLVTVLSLFMTTRLSEWVWKAVPMLAYLPFPSRWQVLTSAGI